MSHVKIFPNQHVQERLSYNKATCDSTCNSKQIVSQLCQTVILAKISITYYVSKRKLKIIN